MCAPSRDFPLDSKPLISVILPTAIPPLGLFEIAKSNIELPVDMKSLMSVGVLSVPSRKYATLVSLNFLFSESAKVLANTSFTDDIHFSYQV